jgi:predicted lipid-binding transport protein (Tim44 family)
MHQAFRNGFEKTSYDYGYESRALGSYYDKRKNDTPVEWGRAVGGGAVAGGLLGTAIGGLTTKRWGGAGAGAAIGGVLGGLIGAGVANEDRAEIANAQYIAALDQERKQERLRAEARSMERSDDQAAQFRNMYLANALTK